MPKPRLVNEYTYSDILTAYFDCRHRKRNTYPALSFEVHYEKNLEELLDSINNGTYKIGSSRVFVVSYPKPREVWAAQFRDRIVHHLVYNDVGPFYNARFISTTCACIEGRGTLYASQMLERYCRSVTENWHLTAWVLQVDIKNFFVSIDRQILWNVLAADIGEDSLTSRLLHQIVFHNPTVGARIKAGTDFSIVPRHKSLWHAPEGRGLPIGDLPSQLCAGVYLDAFDKFVKHVLRCRHYIRFVDDFILLSRDKEQLKEWLRAINAWLREERRLEISQGKTRIAPVSDGINFVGRVVLPFRTYTRRMTAGQAYRAVAALMKTPLDRTALQSVNAYLGLMRHGNTHNLRRSICHKACLTGVIGCDDAFTKIFHIS